MNILFSSDENYARHMGVAMISIMQHNRDVEKIRFFVVNNRITPSTIEKLESLVRGFKNAEIIFIPFESYEKKLHLNLAWPISLSSYARLFVGEMLPTEIDKVLYLDCDVVVCGSISALWETNLNGKCLGAIQDMVPSNTKASVGLLPEDPYFNAGVLLVDLLQWRQQGIGWSCMEFIAVRDGRVTHHDQGVLNGVLKDNWKKLPLQYNVMTIHYMMNADKKRAFYRDKSVFYKEEEVEDAKINPIILHFTPSFTTHPWEHNCKHPLRKIYTDTLGYTPWRNLPLEKDNNPWYVKILNSFYRLSYSFDLLLKQ